jgi:hypothetical protein
MSKERIAVRQTKGPRLVYVVFLSRNDATNEFYEIDF